MKTIDDVIAFIYALMVTMKPDFEMPSESDAKWAIAYFKGRLMNEAYDSGDMADLVFNGLQPLNVEEFLVELAEADAEGCEETESFRLYLLDHYNVPEEDRK